MATCQQKYSLWNLSTASATIQIIFDRVEKTVSYRFGPTMSAGCAKMGTWIVKNADEEAIPTSQAIYDLGSWKSICQFKY